MDARAEAKFTTLSNGYSARFYLLLLLALVLPLRAWLLYNTEVAARDSIGYIRYALEFEERDWGDAIRANAQHPGYSFCVWLMSIPFRAIHGGTDPYVMRAAAQTVSAIASLLLLIPMFYLGKELLGPRIAFWGALLFQYLPVSGHHLSDGVSEPFFLLLTTTALWQAMVAFRLSFEKPSADHPLENAHQEADAGRSGMRQARLAFALSGLFGGLAYWTRPEGAFVVAAVGMVLVGRQIIVVRGQWREFAIRIASLALPALLIAGAYFWVTGEITRKLAPRFMIGWETMTQAGHLHDNPVQPPTDTRLTLADGGSLFASTFASFIPRANDYPTRFRRAGQTFGMELIQGFHYFGAVAALLGLIWYGGFLCRMTGFWVLVIYGLIQAATLIVLAVRVFYISDRHVMVIVLPGSFFMAAGLLEGGRRLHEWLGQAIPRWHFPRWSLTILAIVMLATCLPKTLQTLHGNRLGNHRAGLWLKERLRDGDIVVDDHCWSHYYAGQVFLEGNEPMVPPEYQPTCYVVMTRSKIREIDETRKSEEQRLRDASGRVVFHWPETSEVNRARVVVYALPRDCQSHPWKVAALK